MKAAAAVVAVASALLCFGALAGASAGGSKSAVLFVASDMRGYLGPCGCSENMRGGIARAAQQMKDARKGDAPVFFVDAGDSLFGQTKIDPARVPEEERKARALAEALRKMGLNAKALGEKDDARGPAFRRGLGLPELEPGSFKMLEAGGRKFAVAAGSDAQSLSLAARKARSSGAVFVVGLVHQSFQKAQAVAAEAGIGVDVIVASHSEGESDAEESRLVRSGVPVVQVQSKGRSLMRLDLTLEGGNAPFEQLTTAADVQKELDGLSQRIALLNRQINLPGLAPDAKKLRQQKIAELIDRRAKLAEQTAPTAHGKNAFSIRFIPLEATLPSDPDTKAVVTDFDRDVGKINLEWAKKHGRDCPAPAKGKAAYVGNNACRECHAEAFKVWDNTKHAHAYASLETQGKQYHLDCVGCHVTGYGKPGGVCRIDKVAGRTNVGCESCHGPGSIHVEEPDKTNISLGNNAATCTGCHDPENSPHFDFQTYLPQIIGPGHGAAAH